MTTILKHRALLIVVVAISVIISSLNIYRTIFYKNLSIFQNEQSITIAFNNGKYITLRPTADSLTDLKQKTINPFAQFNDYTFTASGLTLGPLSPTYSLALNNQKAATTVTVSQIGPSTLNLNYKITSDYDVSKSFSYRVELDYSGLSKFNSNQDEISLFDDECRVSTPTSPEHTISNFSDGRSLLFAKAYERKIEFNIIVNINCNED
ncbi:MAG: hypothetical protein ABIM99_04140 [Candidatus Dojkabacteria bacterium]